jgi:hypothetical protein
MHLSMVVVVDAQHSLARCLDQFAVPCSVELRILEGREGNVSLPIWGAMPFYSTL